MFLAVISVLSPNFFLLPYFFSSFSPLYLPVYALKYSGNTSPTEQQRTNLWYVSMDASILGPRSGMCSSPGGSTGQLNRCSMCNVTDHQFSNASSNLTEEKLTTGPCAYCTAELSTDTEEESNFSDHEINLDSKYETNRTNNIVTEFEVFTDEIENRSKLENSNLDPDINYFRNPVWSSCYIDPDAFATHIQSKSQPVNPPFTVLHINCRSMTHKLSEISELANKSEASIIALTETWLDSNLESTIHINGYTYLGKSRTGGRGGGVGLLINNNLKFHHFSTKGCPGEHKTYESLFIRLTLTKSSPVVGVIYRPPGQNLKEFNEEIDELLTGIKSSSKEVILLGDFNIDLLKINEHNDSSNFHNYLAAHHFLPIITRPTRITSDTSTLIDNIFSNAWSKLIEAFIFISDISDHLPICARFSLETIPPKNSRNKKTRMAKEDNLTKFTSILEDENWDDIMRACDLGDANGAYDLFFEKYSLAYNTAFPVIIEEKKHRAKFKKPWMTSGILKSCKKKQKLHTRFIKNPNQQTKKAFTEYRNKFKTIRLIAERNYYTTEFYKHHNDIKATWKLLRAAMQIEDKKVNQITLKINGLLVEDPETIANNFNNYFVTIAAELSRSLPESPDTFEGFLPPSRLNSMGFPLTSTDEILKISTSLKKLTPKV